MVPRVASGEGATEYERETQATPGIFARAESCSRFSEIAEVPGTLGNVTYRTDETNQVA
jgi:hypothetical protein